jgi:DNA-binding NarL/FixJ family response regulator
MRTALLVDDDPAVRAVLRVALRVTGVEVVGEAGTGREAARLAADLRPDVIVLDLGLPDVPARDVLGLVRRSSALSRIVVFSGLATDREWFERRADGFVAKATALDELVALVGQLIADPRDETVVELAYDVIAPSQARRIVSDVLSHWGHGELLDDAAIVVSELVTNAVRHAASPSIVVVNRIADGVRIEVRDEGLGTPSPGAATSAAEGGRGLAIVAALARDWGVVAGERSKAVWVELGPSTPERRG